ncbi:MAG: hypothetical protein ABGW69_01190 [Nanoarchaeota archaeon]
MEILEEKILTYGEVKEILEKEEVFNPRTERLKEFLNSFNILDAAKARQLKEEIEKLDILRLKGKENIIVQIVNFLPKTKEELIQILAGEKITLPEETLEQILEVVKKYV